LNQYDMKPVVDKVYPFAEAYGSFRHLSRGPFGKVVINIAGA